MMITVVLLLGLMQESGSRPPAPDADARVERPVGAPDRRQDQEAPRRTPDVVPVERPDPGGSWFFSAAARHRFVSGTTRVREWDSNPESLDLASEMGMDGGEGVLSSAGLDLPSWRLLLEVDLFRLDGAGRLDHDFDYDEAHLLGGLPFTTHGDFAFVRLTGTFKHLFIDTPSTWAGLVVGLEYPRISVGIDQPGSPRGGSSEQYSQFLPYPIAGLAFEHRLSDSITLSGRVYAGYVPDLPTPFLEGGRLRMTVRTVGADLGVRWQATPALAITAGVGYSTWAGELYSVEDGNELSVASTGLTFGVELRW